MPQLFLALFALLVVLGCAEKEIPIPAGPEPVAPEIIPAIFNGTTSTDARATMYVNGCTGTAIGPNTILTAAHCLSVVRHPILLGANLIIRKGLDFNSPTATLTAARTILHPSYTGDGDYVDDIALIYTRETLPPPYVSTIYDPESNNPLLVGYVAQGYGPSNLQSLLTECEYGFISNPSYLWGECTNPSDAGVAGGDSGGPLYALIDHDDNPGTAPQVQLTGVNVAGGLSIVSVDLTDKASWISANTTPTPIATLSNDAVVWSFFNTTKENPLDLVNGDGTANCTVHLTTTGNPIDQVICEAGSAGGRKASCVASTHSNNLWTCQLEFGRQSANDWMINKLRVFDSLGEEGAVNSTTLDPAYAWGRDIDLYPIFATDNITPTFYAYTVTQAPEAGDTITCEITGTDGSGIKYGGCLFTSTNYDGASDRELSCVQSTTPCQMQVPVDADPGDIWSIVYAFVQDGAGNVTKLRTGQGFEVSDGSNPPGQGYLAVDTSLLPPECAGAIWYSPQLDIYGSGDYGPIAVDDGFYQLNWIDSEEACIVPAANDSGTLTGPATLTLDLSPNNYTVRPIRTASVIVQQDGQDCVGNPGCVGFGPWLGTSLSGYDYTEAGVGNEDPADGPFYNNRQYNFTFNEETGFVTPQGCDFVASATPYVCTGSYVLKRDQLLVDVTQSLASWTISGPDPLSPITGAGDDSIDLVPGNYAVDFDDNLIAYTEPSSVFPAITYGQSPDPTASGDYGTIRNAMDFSIDIRQNGALCDPCTGFGSWSVVAEDGPFIAADQWTPPGPTGTGDALYSAMKARAGRYYTITYQAEAGYTQPNPETKQAVSGILTFVGDYTGGAPACASYTPNRTLNGSVATPQWYESPAKTAGYSTVTYSFYAKAGAAGIDAGVGLMQGDGTPIWSELAARVRFSTGNVVQAWNDDGTPTYECETTCPSYSPNTMYRIVMTANLATGLYDVDFYDPCDEGTPFKVADDFEMTLPALSYPYDQYLDRWAAWENADAANTIFDIVDDVAEGDWSRTGDCVPNGDCNSGAWDCGSPPDGCGGAQSCGTCPPQTPNCDGPPNYTCSGSSSSVFPLSISADGRTLEDQNGDPFLIHADTGWGIAANLCKEADQATCPDTGAREASIDDYFDDLVAKDFNAVLMAIPEGDFTDHSPAYDNAYGNAPFISGTSFASTNMNETYWAHVDYVLTEANDRNLLVILAPFYSGFDNSQGWREELGSQSQATLVDYADWFCTRYAGYPNLLYVWGNDMSTADWNSYSTKLNAMIGACVAADSAKLHTFHGRRDTPYSSYSGLDTQSWIDLRSAYGGDDAAAGDLYQIAETEYLDIPALVTYAFEGVYENPTWTTASARDIRAQHWLAALQGARAGSIYGNENVWTAECDSVCASFKTDNNWTAALNDTARTDMAHLRTVLESVDWQDLVPSFDASVLTSSRGSGINYRAVAKDVNNDFIVIYVNATGNFTVNTSLLNNEDYESTWYDPTTGSSSAGPSGTQGASTSFTHPGNNAGGVPDWALVINAVAPIASRGPSGQWPSGFHSYSYNGSPSTPGKVTAANTSAVQSAMSASPCNDSDGCTIEFTGSSISGTFSSRGGTGPIVIRPAIGNRMGATLGATTIQVNGVVFAGFAVNSGQLLIEGNGSGGLGSGFAWIDTTGNGASRQVVYCNGTDQSNGFFYETITRGYVTASDRGGIRGQSGGSCRFQMVGSIMAGDSGPIGDHPDTLQVYNEGPSPFLLIKDSIIFSSTDKVIQGEWPSDDTWTIQNSYILGPSGTTARWPNGGLPSFPNSVSITAEANVTDSDIINQFNCGGGCTMANSILWNASGGYTDLGGNLECPGDVGCPASYPAFSFPTDAQLDSIWSP